MPLQKLSIADVPVNTVEKISAVGIIGEVTEREVKNGYTQITVPLTYDDADGNERTFNARFQVREEWFDPTFATETLPTLEYKEKIAYQINMQRNVLGLFKSVDLDEIDFDALQGLRVGFSAAPEKNNPSRLEIKLFYAPKN